MSKIAIEIPRMCDNLGRDDANPIVDPPREAFCMVVHQRKALDFVRSRFCE